MPDLGADLIRIFLINPSTGLLEPQAPLVAAPGSGPRHGVFWTPAGTTAKQAKHEDVVFYLTSELNNHVTGYKVTYPSNGTIAFTEFYTANSYGGAVPPNGSKVAEIAISVSPNHTYPLLGCKEQLANDCLPHIAPKQPPRRQQPRRQYLRHQQRFHRRFQLR